MAESLLKLTLENHNLEGMLDLTVLQQCHIDFANCYHVGVILAIGNGRADSQHILCNVLQHSCDIVGDQCWHDNGIVGVPCWRSKTFAQFTVVLALCTELLKDLLHESFVRVCVEQGRCCRLSRVSKMVANVLASQIDVALGFQLCFDNGVFSKGCREYLVDSRLDPCGLEALCGVDEDEEELVEEGIKSLQTVCGDDIGGCVC